MDNAMNNTPEVIENKAKLLSILDNYKKITNQPIVDFVVKQIKENEDHQLSFEKTSQITFSSPKAKNRISTTLGRYIRRQLKLTDKDVDDDVLSKMSDYVDTQIKSLNDDLESGVEVLSGEGFKKAFFDACGGWSCMTGEEGQKKLELYLNNPEKVFVVVTKDRYARALLFVSDCGKIVLNRIYGSGDSSRRIKAWAGKKKYEVNTDPKVRITLKYISRKFPSADSYAYAYIDSHDKSHKKGTIVLSADVNFANAKLAQADGNYMVINRCCNCKKALVDDWGYAKSAHTFEEQIYCQTCFDKCLKKCEICRVLKKKEDLNEAHQIIKDLTGTTSICNDCFYPPADRRIVHKKCYVCDKQVIPAHGVMCYGNKIICIDCCRPKFKK